MQFLIRNEWFERKNTHKKTLKLLIEYFEHVFLKIIFCPRKLNDFLSKKTIYFDNEHEARAYAEEYNRKYNPPGPTPDWYMVAQYRGKVN